MNQIVVCIKARKSVVSNGFCFYLGAVGPDGKKQICSLGSRKLFIFRGGKRNEKKDHGERQRQNAGGRAVRSHGVEVSAVPLSLLSVYALLLSTRAKTSGTDSSQIGPPGGEGRGGGVWTQLLHWSIIDRH